MSMRIKRAMGWGMPKDDFKKFSNNINLYDVFENVDELTVEKEHRSFLFGGASNGELRPPAITEPNLLSTTFTEFGRIPATLGSPEKLYAWVGQENDEHICFFPSLYYRKSWYRSDDDMDYVFEQWRDSQGIGQRGEQADPRSFVTYLTYNPYPWTNYLMLENGKPTPWEHFTIIEKHPEWVPAVASEIRWFCKKLNIMQDDGINHLRPLIAQWWS